MADSTSVRFLTLTDADHGAYLWIAVLLSVGFSTVFSVVRLAVRRHNLWRDDWALLVAQFVAWMSFVATIVALVNGLGKAEDLTTPAQQRRQANVLLLFSLALAESSMGLFIQRVFTMKFMRSGFIAVSIHTVNVTWLLASIIIICARCPPTYIFGSWQSPTCSEDAHRWTAVYAISAGLDTIVVLFPVLLIALLHGMPFIHRVVVAFAFLLRLPLIPLAVAFITQYQKWSKQLSDPNEGETSTADTLGPAFVLPLVLQQCHLAWSLISTSIPAMRGFVRSFSNTFPTKYEHMWVGRFEPGPLPERSDVNPENRSPRSQSRHHETAPNESSTQQPSIIKGWKARSGDGRSKAGTGPATSTEGDSSTLQMKLRPEKVISTTTVYRSEVPPPSVRPPSSEVLTAETNEKFIRQDVHWEVQRSSSDSRA